MERIIWRTSKRDVASNKKKTYKTISEVGVHELIGGKKTIGTRIAPVAILWNATPVGSTICKIS